MEVVLVRFVGAGLALTLSSLDARVPRETIGKSLELIGELARERPPGLSELIDRAARETCRSWRATNVPDAVAAHHLEALPAILEENAGLAAGWAEALALSGEDGPKRADDLAQKLTTEIVSAASSSGALQRSGLVVPVCLVLIDRLLAALGESLADLEALLPALDRVLAAAPRADSPVAPGGLDAAIARLSPEFCPRELLLALVAEDRSNRRADSEILASLESRAYACQELIGDLKTMIRATSDAIEKGTLDLLRDRLEAGDIVGFEGLVGTVEGGADQQGDDLVEEIAGDLRLLRARLDEVRCRWMEAARNYAVARRHRPSFDAKGRWRLMMRQASALTRHGTQSGDIRALFEAAQVHSEAGSLVQEQDAPMEWATAHVELGNLLLRLAEREDRPERYLAAALHFKPAVDVFSRESAMDDWALAQLGLAEALKGQGEFQGDPVILGDAAFAYRAALGMLHAGRSPAEWTTAKAGLGASLVRIAEETGDAAVIDEAVAALKAALARMQESVSPTVEAALGRAYVVIAAEKDDIAVLEEAVTLIDRVLGSDSKALKPAETANLKRQLGSSLWALGEAASDRPRLESALAALASARDRYLAIGDKSTAATIAKDISNLQLVLNRMRHPMRRATDRRA